MSKIRVVFWDVVAILAVAASVYFIYNILRDDGRVSFCLIEEESTGSIILRGERAWLPRLKIGTFKSVSEAKEAADNLHCKIGEP